ncbi:MAG: hypothetical protein SGPRY_003675 [Prymnesium sp.]
MDADHMMSVEMTRVNEVLENPDMKNLLNSINTWDIDVFDFAEKAQGYSLSIRDTIVQLILGTDMRYHFEHYTKFKTKVQSETFKAGCSREDVKFLLSIAMHTADIANPAKPMKCCLQWTELVMEEFFRQARDCRIRHNV